jgi:hypothetical protein
VAHRGNGGTATSSQTDPDSVLFGNCVPVKVLGYRIEPPTAASAPPRES